MAGEESNRFHRTLGCYSELTDRGICEDDKQTGIIYPFDLKPSVCCLPLSEGCLDVTGLEFFWEAGQGQNTRDTSGELRKRSCHCEKRVGDAGRKRVGLDGESLSEGAKEEDMTINETICIGLRYG